MTQPIFLSLRDSISFMYDRNTLSVIGVWTVFAAIVQPYMLHWNATGVQTTVVSGWTNLPMLALPIAWGWLLKQVHRPGQVPHVMMLLSMVAVQMQTGRNWPLYLPEAQQAVVFMLAALTHCAFLCRVVVYCHPLTVLSCVMTVIPFLWSTVGFWLPRLFRVPFAIGAGWYLAAMGVETYLVCRACGSAMVRRIRRHWRAHEQLSPMY